MARTKKQPTNLQVIKDLFDNDPTGLTQGFIMDAIHKQAKKAAELTEEEIEAHNAPDEKGRRPIITGHIWKATGKYINIKMTERYG